MMDTINKLPQENECGCSEYKLKITNEKLLKNPNRFEQLKTQMIYRVNEGCGYAIYFIGVTDKGNVCGISKKEIDESENNLFKLVQSAGLKIVTQKYILKNDNENDKQNLYSKCYIICKYEE